MYTRHLFYYSTRNMIFIQEEMISALTAKLHCFVCDMFCYWLTLPALILTSPAQLCQRSGLPNLAELYFVSTCISKGPWTPESALAKWTGLYKIYQLL